MGKTIHTPTRNLGPQADSKKSNLAYRREERGDKRKNKNTTSKRTKTARRQRTKEGRQNRGKKRREGQEKGKEGEKRTETKAMVS